MNRITEKHLQAAVDIINRVTGNALSPYTKIGGKFTANIGNYHLDGAYGGYSLEQMVSESGAVSDVFRCGHVSKRDLYNRMQAFLTGLETKTT